MGVGGAKRGGRGCWAKGGALRRPAKSCGMGTSAGLLGLFSEHGQSHPLLETDGYLGKYHQLNVRPYEETCVRCVCMNVCTVYVCETLAPFSLCEVRSHSYPWTKSFFRILKFSYFLDKSQVSYSFQGHRCQLNSELKIQATKISPSIWHPKGSFFCVRNQRTHMNRRYLIKLQVAASH